MKFSASVIAVILVASVSMAPLPAQDTSASKSAIAQEDGNQASKGVGVSTFPNQGRVKGTASESAADGELMLEFDAKTAQLDAFRGVADWIDARLSESKSTKKPLSPRFLIELAIRKETTHQQLINLLDDLGKLNLPLRVKLSLAAGERNEAVLIVDKRTDQTSVSRVLNCLERDHALNMDVTLHALAQESAPAKRLVTLDDGAQLPLDSEGLLASNQLKGRSIVAWNSTLTIAESDKPIQVRLADVPLTLELRTAEAHKQAVVQLRAPAGPAAIELKLRRTSGKIPVRLEVKSSSVDDGATRAPEVEVQTLEGAVPVMVSGANENAVRPAVKARSSNAGADVNDASAFRKGVGLAEPNAIIIETMKLNYADAKELARILTELFGGEDVTAFVDQSSNTLIYKGPRIGLPHVKGVVEKLDAPRAATATQDATKQAVGGFQSNAAAGTMVGDFDSDGKLDLFIARPHGAQPAPDEEYRRLNDQANENARKLRQKHYVRTEDSGILNLTSRKPDDPDIEQLRNDVTAAFEARQQMQNARVARLEKELAAIKESIAVRERIKKEIIERRIEDLLNPKKQWEPEASVPDEAQIAVDKSGSTNSKPGDVRKTGEIVSDKSIPQADGEFEALQGVWELNPPPGSEALFRNQPEKLAIVFDRGRHATFQGGRLMKVWNVALDVHVDPKWMVMRGANDDAYMHGIYDVRGDLMRMNLSHDRQSHPKEFGAGGRFEFRRASKTIPEAFRDAIMLSLKSRAGARSDAGP